MRIYPKVASVFAGDPIVFCVSTDRDGEQFHVDLYRQSTAPVWVGRLRGQRGQQKPDGTAEADWGWPEYGFPVPADWPSGAYVAVVGRGPGAEEPPAVPSIAHGDIRDSRALFVVKNPHPGPTSTILMKITLNTYQAYNFTGGASLYTGPDAVTVRRPGGGLGGLPTFMPETHGCCGDEDCYDPRTLRQTFGHWEAPFISWLEGNDVRVDYCTDIDIHCDGSAERTLLPNYQLVLSVGHDEYWSREMRSNVVAFRDRGGSLAIFGANTCYREVKFHDADGFATTDPNEIVRMSRARKWRDSGEPENSLVGGSYANAGGWWGYRRIDAEPPRFSGACDPAGRCDSGRDPVGYTVERPDHWIFDGTGLTAGETFGAEDHLVGYECDGTLFERVDGKPVPTGADGTPLDFEILATAPLRFSDDPHRPGWQATAPCGDPRLGNGVATIVARTGPNGGTVFNASTTDWARVLLNNPVLARITSNVIRRLAPGGHVEGTERRGSAPVMVAPQPDGHGDGADPVGPTHSR